MLDNKVWFERDTKAMLNEVLERGLAPEDLEDMYLVDGLGACNSFIHRISRSMDNNGNGDIYYFYDLEENDTDTACIEAYFSNNRLYDLQIYLMY